MTNEIWFKMTINCKGQLIDLTTPKVMGILNVTPNSFYDGGMYKSSSEMLTKVGKMLSYNKKEVFEMLQPAKFGLPSPNVSSAYVFATQEDFFAYPNNYNYYAGYYKDTFQHGGISMEEMLVPLVTMQPK